MNPRSYEHLRHASGGEIKVTEHSDGGVAAKESHFAFGKNWGSYAQLIDAPRISEAEQGLVRLLGDAGLAGRRFVDIGCGSGVHSLAALRLGASEVLAVDVDADSVATAVAVLSRHTVGKNFTVRQASVFEMSPADFGQFDVVYSWGVLHHTGDLNRALRCAAGLVAPGGLFVFALYRKTLLCRVWKLEKQFYAHARPRTQATLRFVYLFFFRIALLFTGRSFKGYVTNYKTRGMDFYHDVHDWLGGYPYESVSPGEVAQEMASLGMYPIRSFAHRGRFSRIFGVYHGFFGSACSEYVYSRTWASA